MSEDDNEKPQISAQLQDITDRMSYLLNTYEGPIDKLSDRIAKKKAQETNKMKGALFEVLSEFNQIANERERILASVTSWFDASKKALLNKDCDDPEIIWGLIEEEMKKLLSVIETYKKSNNDVVELERKLLRVFMKDKNVNDLEKLRDEIRLKSLLRKSRSTRQIYRETTQPISIAEGNSQEFSPNTKEKSNVEFKLDDLQDKKEQLLSTETTEIGVQFGDNFISFQTDVIRSNSKQKLKKKKKIYILPIKLSQTCQTDIDLGTELINQNYNDNYETFFNEKVTAHQLSNDNDILEKSDFLPNIEIAPKKVRNKKSNKWKTKFSNQINKSSLVSSLNDDKLRNALDSILQQQNINQLEDDPFSKLPHILANGDIKIDLNSLSEFGPKLTFLQKEEIKQNSLELYYSPNYNSSMYTPEKSLRKFHSRTGNSDTLSGKKLTTVRCLGQLKNKANLCSTPVFKQENVKLLEKRQSMIDLLKAFAN